MVVYLRALALILVLGGVAGSTVCWRALAADNTYSKALKGVERYPGNVLYKSELKMAEPRHMILTAGTFGSAPVGIVLASGMLGLAAILERLGRRRQK